MPAAKYDQSDTTSKANVQYSANVRCLGSASNCQHHNNLYNGNKWGNTHQSEVNVNYQGRGINNAVTQWLPVASSAGIVSLGCQQKENMNSAFGQIEGRSYSKNNCISAENRSSVVTSHHSLHSSSITPRDENSEAFGFNQTQMNRNYQCYSLMEPSSNYSQYVCQSNDSAGSLDAARTKEAFLLGREVRSLHNATNMNRLDKKRQKFGLEPVSQADPALHRNSQTAARQFPLTRQSDDLNPNEFSDKNNSFFLSFDQVTSDPMGRGESSAQEINQNMEARTVNTTNTFVQGPHENKVTENGHCGALSRERLRCSISSDPEIYTKTSSLQKVNAQIQKLREEMLALRSTTDSYKQHMEAMFDELKNIAKPHEEKSSTNSEDLHRITDDRRPVYFSDTSNQHRNTRSNVVNAGDLEAEGLTSNKDFVNGGEPFVYPSQPPKASESPASCQSNCNYENIYDVQQKPQQPVSNKMKRGKSNERPNSDPISLCADQTNIMYSSCAKQNTTALSLPYPQSNNKHSAKTSKSPPGNEVKRTIVSHDHLRALPVLNKTNVALHISECSIDSGYQDSSLVSPRERQGRDLASQVVTPASPIDESPFEAPGQPNHYQPVQVNSRMKSRHGNNELSDTTKALPTNVAQISKDFRNIDVFAGSTSLQVFHENEEDITTPLTESGQILKEVQKPKKMKLKSYDGPSCKLRDGEDFKNNFLPENRWSRSSSASNESDEVQKYVRPVPKQRTVFNSSNKSTKSPCSERSFNSPDAYFSDDVAIIPDKLEYSTCFETAALKRNDGRKKSNEKVTDMNQNETLNTSVVNLEPTRPTPPNRLAIFKHSTHVSNDKGSPVQSRVKLGVSSIKLTPDNEKNEGSLFYCTGQVSKTRTRKTANTKQLLREKFAAIADRPSSSLNEDGEHVDGDRESSVVRRRSMRMMTEFQIYDFKDKKTNSSNISKKSVNKSDKQIQNNTSKYVSSSISNNLSKSAPTSRNTVSVSATTVTTQGFETDKKKNKSMIKHSDKKLKHHSCELNSPNEQHNYEKVYLSYTGEPLPPPPSPPRSSPMVDDNPPDITNSHPQIFAKAEPIPHGRIKQPDGVFLAPLIRPKASTPDAFCHVDPHDVPKTTYNGLKISPNAKSAFKPVLSASSQSLENKESSVTEDLFGHEETSADIKRRGSLPSAMVSNKQRFLREFMPNNVPHEPLHHSDCSNVEDNSKTHFCRQSSVRLSKKSNATVTSTKSEERAIERNHNALEKETTQKSVSKRQQPFTTTEPLFSEMPKTSSFGGRKKEHKRRPASDEKKNSSSSSKDQQDLECQPVRFDRSAEITNVVGALKTAGYLRHHSRDQSSQKVCGNSASSQGARSNNEVRTVKSQFEQQPSRPTRPTNFDNVPLKQVKPHSRGVVHHYEVIQPADNKKASKKDRGRKQVARQQTFSDTVYSEDGVFDPSPSKSHKSTVAMIRDSLLGRRDKTSRTVDNEKRKEVPNATKSRSSSVGARQKDVVEPSSHEPSSSTAKPRGKDSKLKKNKTDPKSHKDKSSSMKKISKDQGHKAGTSRSTGHISPEIRPPSPVLPDSGPRRYGDPDSEVMQRFLAAAAASHTNKTPLQRLRSSLRVPKNKNKFLNTSRIKDDMDVGRNPHSAHLGSQFDKNFPHGQEFTYV